MKTGFCVKSGQPAGDVLLYTCLNH